MNVLVFALAAGTALLVAYAYAGYPALLRLLARRQPSGDGPSPDLWPLVSVTIPVFNEEAQIRETLEHLLRVDYPPDRMQILVVSDASTDATDAIVKDFVPRGVELHRRPVRRGKTAAENAVASLLRGEIVVNTDASVRIHPDAIRALVAHFADPGVGVASGRDVSVSRLSETTDTGESGYVDYEMRLRDLETRSGGIIGASGCLYAIRSRLHRLALPEDLSRDFAAALVAREHGYRAVSVNEAVCFVPRTPSLRREYRRKVRTMVRGMRTLYFKRHLLDPFRHGLFAWKLFSHKICRWLVPWVAAAACVAALAASAGNVAGAIVASVAVAAASLVAGAAWAWPVGRPVPRWVALPGFAVWSNLAAIQALLQAPLPRGSAVWEPTRRSGTPDQIRAIRP